jgi:hypothetical protein
LYSSDQHFQTADLTLRLFDLFALASPCFANRSGFRAQGGPIPLAPNLHSRLSAF